MSQIYNWLSDVDVEQVVRDLREEVYPENGLLQDVKLAGDNIMVTCPYHANGMEENVSMGIMLTDAESHAKGTCHCFTCDTTVNLETLISNVHGYNDHGMYGRRWLSRNYLIDTTNERKQIQIVKPTVKEEEQFVTNTVVNMYAQEIPKYVINRGISIDVADYFNVGYDDKEKAVVFPVYDTQNRCRFLQRRAINYKFFKNDEGADKNKVLYGYYRLMEQYNKGDSPLDFSQVFVVESIIDALYLWSNYYPAVATLQAVPTKKQMELIERLPVRTIVAAQDNDDAGNRGAQRLRKGLETKAVKRLVFPDGMKDVNDIPLQTTELKTTIVF